MLYFTTYSFAEPCLMTRG